MLVDIEGEDGRTTYVLPPPMAGFFEFSMMRTRGDIDQKALAELFYQYLNVEEDFIKALFAEGDTQLGRVFVQEPMLSRENAVHVLDYERASEVIRTASHRAISTCYCRHKMEHVGRDCDAPCHATATPGPWTRPNAWTSWTRPRSMGWCSSGRTCASGSTSSATAAGAAARP
jgi:hypothetical protein